MRAATRLACEQLKALRLDGLIAIDAGRVNPVTPRLKTCCHPQLMRAQRQVAV
jgi:hypothetical protein